MAGMQEKYLGGMIGSALGDAIGELAFRYRTEKGLCARVEQVPELRYTDDTAMSIGLAESIIRKGELDQQDLGDTFRKNYAKEPWRGYASGPPTIFSMVDRFAVPYREAAESLFGGEGSLGNGAAMRIVPVGLFFSGSPDIYEKAGLSASVTHAHPVGIDGAAIQAKAVSLVLNLDPKDQFSSTAFIDTMIEFAETRIIKEKMQLVKRLLAGNTTPSSAAEQLGRTVAVDESMPFALFSFLRHPKSFEDCLFCAVLNGGDRDTLGAMACAVSGAYGGIDSIPRNWVQKLENRSYIEELAKRLFLWPLSL
jgi:poly(ADP-ribose) glycohydrolase ARH3